MWRLYFLLVPFVLPYNIIRAVRRPYPYAVNELARKQFKSFRYNIWNETGVLKSMGPQLYCKYAFGTAKEGIDFITVNIGGTQNV